MKKTGVFKALLGLIVALTVFFFSGIEVRGGNRKV